MRLKYKFLLLAVLPLLASVLLIAWSVQQKQVELAEKQRLQLRAAYMAARESELRHYIALALSTISPLYNSGRNDTEIQRQAMQLLAKLDYGPDGYFFLYDLQGVNLMDPRQPELVGKDLIELRDASGDPTIRMLLERARAGGGFVVHQWLKPSTQKVAAKLGYVTPLDRWQWMLGTGLYLDDFEAVMDRIDHEVENNERQTLWFIAGAGLLGLALLFAGGLALRISDSRQSDAKLQLLARKVVNSQEDERARLARELHDGTSQTLVAAKLLIESALDRTVDTQPAVRGALSRALDRLREALAELRDMSHRLRPVLLDTLGLPAALQHLGEEICGAAGVHFTIDVEGQPVDLPDDVKTVLFRITQESLGNCLKHAPGAAVGLLLCYESKGLRLAIHDDGQGFDVEQVRMHPRRGIGLRNMRERIEGIGGLFDLQSQPGLTRITATLGWAAVRRFDNAAKSALHA